MNFTLFPIIIIIVIINFIIYPSTSIIFKYLLNLLFNFDSFDIYYQIIILILLIIIPYIIIFFNSNMRFDNKKIKDINIHTLRLLISFVFLLIIITCSASNLFDIIILYFNPIKDTLLR